MKGPSRRYTIATVFMDRFSKTFAPSHIRLRYTLSQAVKGNILSKPYSLVNWWRRNARWDWKQVLSINHCIDNHDEYKNWRKIFFEQSVDRS